MAKKATLDPSLLERRIHHLQCMGIVVNTGRLHVTRDGQMRWINLVFEQDYGAYIEQIKVLSRFNFLIIFGSFEEQQHIPSALPMYMNGKIVVALPWATNLKTKPIGPSDTPIWIDLMFVDPVLEIYSNYLLKGASCLIFAATLASQPVCPYPWVCP